MIITSNRKQLKTAQVHNDSNNNIYTAAQTYWQHSCQLQQLAHRDQIQQLRQQYKQHKQLGRDHEIGRVILGGKLK